VDNWAEATNRPQKKDPFCAGLFFVCENSIPSKGVPAQLQDHAWLILARVKVEEWYDNYGLFI
jgi:hypothetical protein